MVRPMWIAIAFIAGVAVGILVMRMSPDAPAGGVMGSAATPPSPRLGTPHAAPSIVATSTATADAPDAPPATVARATDPPAAESLNAVLIGGSPAESVTVESGAVAQPIDVGEVFGAIIARPSQPGLQNQLGDAHRALERETRDDGWSYSMEAEIQNAMVKEVSTGEFRAEHIECRATMCEVRLSGRGDQAAAVKRWTESVGGQSFGQQLFLNHASTIGGGERVDALLIWRRPPKKG